MAKRKKRIRIDRLILLLIVIAGVFYISKELISYFGTKVNVSLNQNKTSPKDKTNTEEERNKELQNNYEVCLNKPYSEDKLDSKLQDKIAEIDNLIRINNYQASVYYEDLTTGFTYKYQPTTVYYGCSLIKLVDALYLINAASDNTNSNNNNLEYAEQNNTSSEFSEQNYAVSKKLDLDEIKLVYESKYVAGYSSGLASHKIGDAVSLRNLIKYAISVSDNSAHLMLIDFIGFNNLKSYGNSLGGKVILTGGDNFGNQTAEDTNIYLKEAYKIITQNKEYGPFLKEIMDNDERNAFNTDDIRIYHKYGSYGNNYHDIGLSLDAHPYAISILTLHEKSNYTEVVQTIHAKIRELRDLFYESRESNCYKLIYEDDITNKKD